MRSASTRCQRPAIARNDSLGQTYRRAPLISRSRSSFSPAIWTPRERWKSSSGSVVNPYRTARSYAGSPVSLITRGVRPTSAPTRVRPIMPVE